MRLYFVRLTYHSHRLVFTAWRYASMVYAVIVCLAVCPSGLALASLQSWLNWGSHKQRITVAKGL